MICLHATAVSSSPRALGHAPEQLVARDLEVLGRVGVARGAPGRLAADEVERQLEKRLEHPRGLADDGGLRTVRLEALSHRSLMLLRLELVVLEPVDHLGIVGRRNQAVQHAQHRLLERMRFVDVLHELGLEIRHRTPPHLEFADGAAERRRTPAPAGSVLLEDVDEERERRSIAELGAAHVEPDASPARHEGLSTRPRDALAHRVQGRQRAGDAPEVPDAVELFQFLSRS